MAENRDLTQALARLDALTDWERRPRNTMRVGLGPMQDLAVRLGAGESWTYEPPADHTIAWMSVGQGSLFTSQRVEQGELVVFEDSNAAIEVHAETDTELVLGSAHPSPSDLALGAYSVHSSLAALEAGQGRIRDIGARLRAEGQL